MARMGAPNELESGSHPWGQRQTLGSGPGLFRSTGSYQTLMLELLSLVTHPESSGDVHGSFFTCLSSATYTSLLCLQLLKKE